MASGMSLEAFYDVWFKLKYHCKLTFDEFYNMLPFELSVFIGMFNIQREKEEEERKKQK